MHSRMALVAALAATLLTASGAEAVAKPKITEKTEYYRISGKTGRDLLRDMNRRGPRHGWLTKAIAQTRYETRTFGDMVGENGKCRVRGGGVSMTITYIYPQPREKLSREMARRWKFFQADNVRHEKTHGRIAREMAAALETRIKGFETSGDRRCWAAKVRLERETRAIFDAYKKKQAAFDEREHRDGGSVDKSIAVLLGKG